MNHSFSIEIAKEYGIEPAIILENMLFWIEKNIANNKNYFDGNYWTYNSIKAFSDLFPYMSAKKIRSSLELLEKNGLILTGNYNKVTYDRTKWYALTEKAFALFGKSICPTGQIELPQKENRIAPQGEPIPDINTDINKDVNTDEGEKRKRFVPPSPEVYDFVQWFYDTMDKPTRYVKNPPNLEQWCKPIDLLNRVDGVDFEHMRKIAYWALNNDFWKSNILSTSKFREKFSTLEMQSKREKPEKPDFSKIQDPEERRRAFAESRGWTI